MTRATAILAAVLAVCALAAPAARADGDPASDTLISLQVFLPYYLKLPPQSTKQLMQVVSQAKRKGYTVRVALIAHTYDLGSAGALWRMPQSYAKFLAQELASYYTGWVLTAMPNGYGIYHCVPKRRQGGDSDPCESARPSAADRRILAAVPTAESSHKDIAAATTIAVRRLAALHGAQVGSGGGNGLQPILAGGGAALLLVVLGAGLFWRSRRARTPGAAPE